MDRHRASMNHFQGKHIDLEQMKSTDFSGVMKITHDIKIGFNRFEIFQDRFKKQKAVCRNNNFKLICGGAEKSNQEIKDQKHEAVKTHLKNKRMVTAMQQLRKIGTELDDVCWGTDFVDEKILDNYVKGLRNQIKAEKEKGHGKIKSQKREEKRKNSKQQNAAASEVIVPVHAQPKQKFTAPVENKQKMIFQNEQNNSEMASDSKICKLKTKKLDTMEEQRLDIIQNIAQEQLENNNAIKMLLDPSNNLVAVTRDDFEQMLMREQVFDEVANRIYSLQNEKNQKLNLEFPLMVKLQTSVQQVKKVLTGIDQSSFVALRDLKLTPNQLHSQKLQRLSGMKYSVLDDMREVIGNENLNQPRFCGIVNRLINQRAKTMGRLERGYEKFYLDEITNHADEMPGDEKCIRSLLSKQNTLKNKNDEILAKKLLKQAKNRALGIKSNSEERLLASLKSERENGDSKQFNVSLRPRIKTLEEIHEEKKQRLEEVKNQKRRDRLTVLDNIYLLRLKEQFPSAVVNCPAQIQILIDAYLRRNMVQAEVQKEVALAKLMDKKPRPFKLIRGLAVVRPGKTEYLDNDPLGKSPNKRGPATLSESSGEGKETGAMQKYGTNSHAQMNQDIGGVDDHSQSRGKSEQQRVHMKQLDMTKIQVMSTAIGEEGLPMLKSDSMPSNQDDLRNFNEEYVHLQQHEDDCSQEKTTNRVSGCFEKDENVVSLYDQDSKQFEGTQDHQNLTYEHQNWMNMTQIGTIRGEYLLASDNNAQVLEKNSKQNHHRKQHTMQDTSQFRLGIQNGDQSQDATIDMMNRVVQNEQSDGLKDRESPNYQMSNNLMQLGMFEQKSEDITASDIKLHPSRAKKSIDHQHKSARHELDRNKRAAYGIREPKFNMQKVRDDAIQRRGRVTQGTLSAFRNIEANPDSLTAQEHMVAQRRLVSSARTKDSLSKQPHSMTVVSANMQNSSLVISRGYDPSKEHQHLDQEMTKLLSNATTAPQSYLNSQKETPNKVAQFISTTSNPNLSNGRSIYHHKEAEMTQKNGVPSMDQISFLQPEYQRVSNMNLKSNYRPNYSKQSLQSYYTKQQQMGQNLLPVMADHTTQVSPQNRLNGQDDKILSFETGKFVETQTDYEDAVTATKGRFPARETHTLYVKRKLNANPSLAATSKRDELIEGCGSKANLLGSRMQQRQGSNSVQKRRPKTGTMRAKNLTSLLNKNPTSTVATTLNLNVPDSILRQRQKLSSQRGMISSESYQEHKVTERTTFDAENVLDEEFCEVPESQLPDRILSFMENNDLPIFIDQKKCNTIRFRTSRPDQQLQDYEHNQPLLHQKYKHSRFTIENPPTAQHQNNYWSMAQQDQVTQDHKKMKTILSGFKSVDLSQSNTNKSAALQVPNSAALTDQLNNLDQDQQVATKRIEQQDSFDQRAIVVDNGGFQELNTNSAVGMVGIDTEQADRIKTMPVTHTRPVSSKPPIRSSLTNTAEIQGIYNSHLSRGSKSRSFAQQNSKSTRRRVMIKNGQNTQSGKNIRAQVSHSRIYSVGGPPPRNETPQIINIVENKAALGDGQLINKDLLEEECNSINNASDQNQNLDSASNSLPKPLFQKSKTLKMNDTKSSSLANRKGSASRSKIQSKKRSKRVPSGTISLSQQSQHVLGANASATNFNNGKYVSTQQEEEIYNVKQVYRTKACTPNLDSAMQQQQSPQPDMLSMDHPMENYVPNANYQGSNQDLMMKEQD